ncbi:MAG TPA: hypothetical protein PKA28_01710 [Methylomusa anaerophila]|uniref:Uncharacterized protein n=1 Tax=Methylomusa anaerophila TaxID=1930071 RepID=A0A348APM1_9FIRM|nr:hypothetical protein [Methylomusa anaerophila]BBB93019.1 hypothetical protein MAMMFC1_03728 [Methylomusa anaerophila]HML87148.1 hypothetical protein [Methylomusa anaerophila]
MKIKSCIVISLFILLIGHNMSWAISPINQTVIKDAQKYGMSNIQKPLTDFLLPWVAYEEQANILNATTESAYLYTPYLLIAADARDKALNQQTVKLTDTEKILSDYAGYLVFSVTLYSDGPSFMDDYQIILRQEKTTLKPYQSLTNPVVKSPWHPQNPQFMSQCYFYFSQKTVNLTKVVSLILITGDKREHRFHFDLSKIK